MRRCSMNRGSELYLSVAREGGQCECQVARRGRCNSHALTCESLGDDVLLFLSPLSQLHNQTIDTHIRSHGISTNTDHEFELLD